MSFSSRLGFGVLGAVWAVACIGACGGDIEPTDDDASDDDASVSSSSSGSQGGSSGAADGSTQDATGDSSSDVACVTELDCNGDPEVSSVQGSCQLGICMCNDQFVVQPSGKCGKTPAPTCVAQSGTCVQGAACPAGQLASDSSTNMSCGDLVAAVCCFDPGACKGPTFHCADPTDAQTDPLCVNGWKTCPDGTTPVSPR